MHERLFFHGNLLSVKERFNEDREWHAAEKRSAHRLLVRSERPASIHGSRDSVERHSRNSYGPSVPMCRFFVVLLFLASRSNQHKTVHQYSTKKGTLHITDIPCLCQAEEGLSTKTSLDLKK